ncbi:hypothetical protein [Noviherbaspirillum malthae]|jgi:hypothetical protein|nr:hypothetical protein [Noviherbaspirillum malthae]
MMAAVLSFSFPQDRRSNDRDLFERDSPGITWQVEDSDPPDDKISR